MELNCFCYSTHPGTGVPIVLAGSKLTSDQVTKSFGKEPLPRKIESTKKPYSSEVVSGSLQSQWLNFTLACFVITFLFFFFFPQDEATGKTPASFINNLLPYCLRVHDTNAHNLF
jgi:phytoene desaturase (3,4-didehydrolycopene-forming)